MRENVDASGILEVVKRAAVGAIGANKPADVLFGTVTCSSPLTIAIDQKMTIGIAQIILTQNVTNHTVRMSITHQTEDEQGHKHRYEGVKEYQVMRALSTGERIIMIRQPGGQKFVVLDRCAK